MLKRRRFLTQCLAAPLLINYSPKLTAASRNTSSSIAYLAAAQSRLGEYSLQCFNHGNEILAEHEIPSRGHGFSISPQGHIAAIARRPADFCLILDRSGNKLTEFSAHDGRHFYGHGVFDSNGDYLYLTENDFAQARGVIGIYEVRNNYQRIGEFDSYGVGPHMVQLDNTGSQLIVANGGIETHPNTGRKKLNLTTMQPSMVFIDLRSGDLVRKTQLSPQYHKNSIRHFSIATDNTIYIGLQNEGGDKSAALLAKLSPTSSMIEKMTLTEPEARKLNNYVGDICLDQSQQFLVASSPYGNTLLIKSLANNQYSQIEVADVCAISSTTVDGQFAVSGGDGMIYLLQVSFAETMLTNLIEMANFAGEQHWDNHILVIDGSYI